MIKQKEAMQIIESAYEASKELETKMNIAVVDAGGNLKSFFRADGAWLGSIDIAIKKAKTSVFFQMDSGTLGRFSQPGKPLYGIEHSNNGLITFPGGEILENDKGEIIGAIGVSGDSVENDEKVALAGVNGPWK